MMQALREVLAAEPIIAYALLFGSRARGTAHEDSDVDLAIGGRDLAFSLLDLGGLIARLEEVAGASVDLVLLDEAPPGLAFRIFQEGRVLFDRDHSAFLERKAKAMLEYYDWQPIEARLARAVLEAAQRGR
ncbi:MAG: nucleotidyltransferase domain-containing protein [Planctomycetes bacterium]|nr:nucleotidyltransferase domain-containing protein [Planctomycetota bacterium]